MPFDSASAKVASNSRKTKSGGCTASIEKNLTAKAEEVSEIVKNTTHWFGRPIAKTDDEVLERIMEFFDRCAETGELPTVEKMCLALGTTRKTVWEWENGLKGTARAEIIRQAKEALAAIDAELVNSGKIPVVSYIFRGKNYFGLKDVSEVVTVDNNRLGADGDVKTIAQKYAEAIPQINDKAQIEEKK